MPLNTIRETMQSLLPSILLALVGSLARYCLKKEHSFWVFIQGLAVSGFAGAIAALLLMDAPLSINTKIAIGGMAGFSGDWFLNSISRKLLDKVGGGT